MNIDLRLYMRWIAGAILVLTGFSLTGCSEEMPGGVGSSERQGVTLMIPAAPQFAGGEGEGSGTSSVLPEELKYTSLTFFAFPQNGDGEALAIPLTVDPNGEEMTVKDHYRQYTVPLKKGTYRFFLVANCFGNAETTLPQTEDDLKEELLEYDTDFTGTIPVDGLPMSAAHSDFRVEKNGDYFSASDSFTYDGNGTTLYADMTFACAKVTLEVKDFEEKSAKPTGLTLCNLSKQVPVIFTPNYDGYGKVESASINVGSADETADAPESVSFYVPERYVASGKENDQSKLSFTVNLPAFGDREITLPLGERQGTEPYAENLKVPGENDLRELHRGTHYIYRLNPLADVTLSIEPWEPIGIAYAHGPVYLHVEKQEYTVEAGKETALWYDSDVDAKDIYVDSPMFTPTGGGDPVPIYDYKIESDSIRIWVNEDIKSSWYDQIKNNTKYDFFHIVAGPIHKRIMVNPLKLDYYLYVTPEEVPVNARIRVASGEYSGSLPVEIHTNYPYLKIQRTDGWNSTLLEGVNSTLLTLTDEGDNHVGLSDSFYETSDPLKNLKVMFSGLNSGNQFWKDSHQLTFTVTGSENPNGTGSQKEIPVRIVTTPNVLNYKIHFKATGWSNPHIYVYQCLEFPGDWNQTFDGQSMASKPIGYHEGNSYLASLEYSFTGKIAFKGWDNPINYSELYNNNGTKKEFTGRYEKGFYIFNDDGSGSWRIDYKNTMTVLRYNFDMDFCKKHREDISDICPKCASVTEYHKVFPGIQMKRESDDWWGFELTGVAVPGRSLIMFADKHDKNDKGKWNSRFPAENDISTGDEAPVGLTLFDYPNREGWFWFNGDGQDRINNVFKSEDPGVKYRIYWPKAKYGAPKKNIYMWLLCDDNVLGDVAPGGWFNKPTGSVFSNEDKYYHYDFTYTPNPGIITLKVILTSESDQYRTDFLSAWPLTTFTLGKDGYRSAYIDQDHGQDGKLIPGIPPNLN